MSLKKHYLISSRRSIKPYFKLIIMFCLLITVSKTFARYTYVAINSETVAVTKWNIVINGENIADLDDSLNANIELLNVKDDTTNIDSGDVCYFDIIINPELTEVSISYSILIDLEKSNLPNETKILKYEKFINADENEELSKTENINDKTVSISEIINLPETQKVLDKNAIRRYRVYCEIPFPAEFEKDDVFTITPQIILEQYIG